MDDDDDAAFTPIRRTSMPERFSPVTDSGSPERPSIANQQHLQQQQQQQLQLPASAVVAAFPSHNQQGGGRLSPTLSKPSSLPSCCRFFGTPAIPPRTFVFVSKPRNLSCVSTVFTYSCSSFLASISSISWSALVSPIKGHEPTT